MSERDETKRKLTEALVEFLTHWTPVEACAAAILDAVDARIREAMKPPEPSEPGDTLVQVPHAADCDSRRSTVVAAGGDRIGARMQPLPCSCDYWERALAANVRHAKPTPVEPEATAAKTWRCTICGGDHPTGNSHTEAVALQAQGEILQRTLEKATAVMLESAGVLPAAKPPEPSKPAAKTSEAPCSCREIQAADPSRHFKGCARRVEMPHEKGPHSLHCRYWPGGPHKCICGALDRPDPPAAEPPEPSKPAAVGPEPPERVTLYIAQDGDWWKFQTSDPMTPEMPAVTYVRASAYEKAVELLRSAVERWPSYNVRDDVVAFLAEHDAAARKT